MWFLIKNNPEKLLMEFKSTTSSENKSKIVDRLIELNAEKELFGLLDKGFNNKIVPVLIEINEKHPDKLFYLFGKDTKSDKKLIDKLIDLRAEDHLIRLINKEYNHIIIPFVIDNYKRNSSKLVEFFGYDKTSNVKIIDSLIENKADKELLLLVGKGYNAKIMQPLINFNKDNADKLYNLIGKDKEYDAKIIERLIELKAENELKNLIGKGYNQIIIPFFVEINKNHPDKLIELFGYDELSNLQIIDFLIENKAEEVLLSLASKAFDNKIIQFLIDLNKNNPMKLFDLFGRNKITDEIIFNRLIQLKAIEVLKRCSNSDFNLELLSLQSDLEIFTKDEILRILKIELFNRISKPDFTLEDVFLELLVFFTKIKNLTDFNTLLTKYYNDIFEYGIFNKCIGALLISYLLDKEIYRNKISEMQKKFHIVENSESAIDEIKNRYSDKIVSIKSKEEVDKLLNQRNIEINNLFEKNKIDLASNLILEFEKKYINAHAFKGGKHINLLSYKILRIVDDVNDEKNKLDQSIKQELYNLEDSNEIMKAKNRYNMDIDRLVSKSDFIYTVNNLKLDELNNKEYIELLGNILVNTNDLDIIKTILFKSTISNQIEWLNYIYQLELNKELRFYIADMIRNKYSSKNFDVLLNKDMNIYFDILSFYKYRSSVKFVTFSPDGKYLACVRGDANNVYEVKINRMSDFMEVKSYDHSNVNSVSFSPDGKYIVSCSGESAKIISLSDFKEVNSYKHNSYITLNSFSPNGKYLACVSNDLYNYIVKVIRLSDFKEVCSYKHNDRINSVSFSHDEKYITSGSSDKTVKIIRLSDSKEVCSYKHNAAIDSVSFSPDGKYLASGSRDTTVIIIRLSDFKEVNSYKHNDRISSVLFSPDGKYLVSGTSCSYENTVKIIRLCDFKEVNTYRHTDYVESICFSPDSKYLVSGSRDRTIKIIRLSDYKEVYSYLNTGQVYSVTFSADAKYIASGGDFNTLNLIRINNLDCLILFNHLFYLYFYSDVEDIRYLKAALNKLDILPENMQTLIKKIIENIIERSGRKSNTIMIADRNNPNSKEIEIKD